MSESRENSDTVTRGSETTKSVPEVVDAETEHEERRKRLRLQEIAKRPVPNLNTLRSGIYQLFTWDCEVRQWKCNHCRKTYTHGAKGGTSSLTKHISSEHKKIIESAGGIDKLIGAPAETMKKFLTIGEKLKAPPVQTLTETGFREKLIEFIVGTDQPFSIVEHPLFQNFINYCTRNNEKGKLPSNMTVRREIEAKYKAEKEVIKRELAENTGKISLTVDGWTSSNQYAFQGVIASWISNEWQLCHSVIDLTILQGSHSGENIANALCGVLDDFQLWKKLLAITTDNASNMNTMFATLDLDALNKESEFQPEDYRVRCLAHILNLSCQDMIAKIGGSFVDECEILDEDEDSDMTGNVPFLEKIRRAIGQVRSSPQRREIFKRFCEQENLSQVTLILDCKTRWNSTLMMIQRLIAYKKPFLATLSKVHKLRHYLPLFEDDTLWKRLQKLTELLSPFEEATRMISQGHSPTLSDTSTVYIYLFRHLEKYMGIIDAKIVASRTRSHDNSEDSWIVQAAAAGWDKLSKYYLNCDNLVYVVATVMDPRYKLQWFKVNWEKQYFEAAKKKVQTVWNTKYKPSVSTDDEPNEECLSLNIADLIAEQMNQQGANRREDELKRYLNDGVVSSKQLMEGLTSVLNWWKVQAAIYPNLSKMAKDFLSASATGVVVERLFSAGPDLLSSRRQKMNPGTIRECMCLKQWYLRKDKENFSKFYADALKEKLGIN